MVMTLLIFAISVSSGFGRFDAWRRRVAVAGKLVVAAPEFLPVAIALVTSHLDDAAAIEAFALGLGVRDG